MGRTSRRFNLGDMMILIAALAAACVGMRSYWLGHLAGRGVIAPMQAGYNRLLIVALASAAALPMTVAWMAWRLRQPRPPWRRVALRPGTAAGLACLTIFGTRALEWAASLLKPDINQMFGFAMNSATPIRFGESSYLVLVRNVHKDGVLANFDVLGCHGTWVAAVASPCGPAVAAVWLVLAVAGRWRPEPSWIDRSGRVLGVTWIVLAALTAIPI